MAAFAAAKKAAQQRGIQATAVQSGETPAWRNPGTIVKTVFLLAFLAGIGWLGYHFFGPKPPRYLQFPSTARDAAQLFLTRVNGGDATFDQAYFLIADSARSPKASDDRGDYMQVCHTVDLYLAAEFGQDWITQTQLAPDPADPTIIVAKVALETLRIHTAQQTPPDRMAQYGPHFGILGIEEVDVAYAGELQHISAILNVVEGVAGTAALNNLKTIIGAYESNRHLPLFIKKMELLSVLRNPHSATWKSIVQTDPMRNDPVVQARLAAIVQDDRYSSDVRDYAKKALEDKLTDEDKAAVDL